MKELFKNLFFAGAIILLLGAIVSKTINPSATVSAHGNHHDNNECEEKTYKDGHDFDNERVNVNIMNYDHDDDRRVVINPKSGYKLTFIGIDYKDGDNYEATPSVGSGFSTITYTAPHNESIDHVTVKVDEICETPTPTITPTITPTTTPTIIDTPTPTPGEEIDCDDQTNQTEVCIDCDGEGECEVIIGETPTPTPTEEVTPEPEESTSSDDSDSVSQGDSGESEEVLGTETMAPTGTFDSLISNGLLALGLTFTTLAGAGHATKKK